MIIHKCDKCGKQVEQKAGQITGLPNDWQLIRFDIGHYQTCYVHYELCTECADILKIPREPADKRKNLGDRLIEVITEIAQDSTAE